jgi:hypothetical protein
VGPPPIKIPAHWIKAGAPLCEFNSLLNWVGTSDTKIGSSEILATTSANSFGSKVEPPATLSRATGTVPAAIERDRTLTPAIEVTGNAQIQRGGASRLTPIAAPELTNSFIAPSWVALSSTPRGFPVDPEVVTMATVRP